MKKEDFATLIAGRLINAPQGYLAFVLAPPPLVITYTPALVRAISDADAALSELSGTGRLLPNPHVLIAPYVRREAVLSSRIEGTQASLKDTIVNATPYHFGLLTSTQHMGWVRTVCGRLKGDFRYSAQIVYNNFPWPVAARQAQRDAIASKAQAVLDARAAFPTSTFAVLYGPRTMPPALLKAHQALDRAVDAAYTADGGPRSYASDAERVAFLFTRYAALTSLV